MSFQATSVDLRYQAMEDRLQVTLRGDTETVDLMITRRLTRAILSAFVDLLMRSSTEIGRVPASARGDVLLFEHMEAAHGWAQETPPAAPSTADAQAPQSVPKAAPTLTTKVDIGIRQGSLSLVFFDQDGERSHIILPRDKAHRLLSMLVEKCHAAQWDIGEMSWLGRRGQVVIPDRASLS